MWQPVPSMGGPAKAFPPDFGWDLWVAYAVWIAIVVGAVSAVPLVRVGEGAQSRLVAVVPVTPIIDTS